MPNIVIKADITFKKLTPSANSNIYLYYTNENTVYLKSIIKIQNLKARSTTSDTVPVGLVQQLELLLYSKWSSS